MKKLIIALLIFNSAFSQIKFKDKETFNVSVVLDPGASIKEKGLNIGSEIEYSGPVYVRCSLTSFGVLEGGYLDLTGAFGFTLSLDRFEKTEAYSGIRIGIISRASNSYPTYGLECGINRIIGENLIIGIRSTYDRREDFIFTGGNPSFRYSGFVKIGYRWNYKN